MPEIAEVEVLRHQLEELVGAKVVGVDVEDSKLAAGGSLGRAHGQVTALRRHGKLLGLALADGTVLACHLRMTGALTFARQPHTRAVIRFADARPLYFSDPRRFGVLELIAGESFGAGLGPDLFDAPEELAGLWVRVQRLRRPVKAVLLDQQVLAGIGNYIADEAAFACCIHPQAPAWLLGAESWGRLCAAARAIALQSLELGGVSLRDYKHADGSAGSGQTQLRCYGQAGKPCGRCGTIFVRTVVAGRGTTFCPRCQAQELLYTNFQGERVARTVLPTRLYYGSSSWHPRRQWLLDALDLGKGELRTFAIADISGWAPANDKAPAA